MQKSLAFTKFGTPVNAANAAKVLTLTGVVIDGETVTINHSDFPGSDRYYFSANTAAAAVIAAQTTKATGTLTLPTQPTAGDKMVIGGKIYTFVAYGTTPADGTIVLGTNIAATKLVVVTAINGTDNANTPNPMVSASAFNSDICTLTALISGLVGDMIGTTETFTAVGNVFDRAKLSMGSDSNIVVDITANTTKSTGTLTVDTQPTVNDTMTIGGKVYTFVALGTTPADGKIVLGSNIAATKPLIVAAINGVTGSGNVANPMVSASNFSSDACTLTALIGGVAGDAIATTETFTASTNIFAAGTLGSGADCSAANAITALVAAITASDTQGVGAAAGGGTTVVLTADTAGIGGNRVLIAKSMANATFAAGATNLSGGVDGTVAPVDMFMHDATYLYVLVADNTKTDKNWRRISIGSAF